MSEFYDSIHQAMSEGPLTAAELATHQIASQTIAMLNTIDEWIAITRDLDNPLAKALASEWVMLDKIGTKAQWLASFGEVQQRPVGLRMIRGKRS